MNRLRVFCIAFSLLTASSALSQDVHYDFDKTANFSKFKTYKWITLKSDAPIEGLTDEQIKAALGAVLARKGLTKVEGDSAADLLIGYQTTERFEQHFAGEPGWSPGPGWQNTAGGNAWTLHKGELAVTIYDAAKHELVWRGVASKAYPKPYPPPEKRQKNLQTAVEKLMKNYPPPAQK